MKKIFNVVLPILTCFLSIAAVVIGSVAVVKANKEPEIYNVYQIGLNEIFEYDEAEMSVFGPWPSDYIKSEVDDKDLSEKVYNALRDAIRDEMFTTAKKPKFDSKPGSGWRYTVTFTVNKNKYSFSAVGYGKLEIIINGEDKYYFSDCFQKVNRIINETVEYLSPEK